jgi:3-deoxy-D-manno-octulosonate 8-phosphate phosphatase (KDO 8-P phosphatase)
VLTDGRIYLDHEGNELKAFSVLDGVGLKRLADAGVAIAWITGSLAPAVEHRARRLGVERVVLGAEDKLHPWERLAAELRLAPGQCAHIGDDLPDIAILQRCGLAATVPHAPRAVRVAAHYVTTREAGLGAVRELCDLILDAQGVAAPYAVSGA